MIVAIEALIGTGKTTVVEHLDGVKFYEPVEANPFLDLYYADPARWAYAMQVNLLWERYKAFQEAHYRSLKGERCLMDRSYYGDYAFAIVQHEAGYFTEAEFSSYERMHEALQPNLVYPDLLVWLELSPAETLERIKQRGRECESSISLKYLERLDAAYKKVLKALEPRCNIIRVDARPDALAVLGEVQSAIAEKERELKFAVHPCYK